MPPTSILFLAAFAVCAASALAVPVIGLLAYMLDYAVGPGSQWYGRAVGHLGLRYSMTLALATLIGAGLHWQQLRPPGPTLQKHEKLLLAMLAAVWLSVMLGAHTVGRYSNVDHPSVKFTKLVVLTFVMTHLITSLRRLNWVLWILVVSGLLLGWRAYDLPRSAYRSGRVEGVGGPDFAEANFLGAYMAVILVITAIVFLRSRWRGRAVAFLAGGFIANTIVLVRSRGTVLGMGIGAIVAVILSPKRLRPRLIVLLIVGALGFLWLTDPQFLERTATMFRGEEQRDESAQSRIVLFRASLRMLRDKPLGIGVGNFYQTIGRYVPAYAGKDAHNTFVRCYTELGIQGFAVFAAVIVSAFLTLHRIRRAARENPDPEQQELAILAFGLTVALATLLGCCITVSLTYVEFLWWFLMLPVCLHRAAIRVAEDQEKGLDETSDAQPSLAATPV